MRVEVDQAPLRRLGQSAGMKLVVNPAALTQAEVEAAQLQKLDRAGPNYTSYPSADRFVDSFGPEQYRQSLRQRAQGPVVGGGSAWSLAVHAAFGESPGHGHDCVGWLTREVELHRKELGSQQPVSQLQLRCCSGAGKPSRLPAFLNNDELDQLMRLLRGAFRIVPGAELSIDADPRTASPARLRHFCDLGFNHLSFSAQAISADLQQQESDSESDSGRVSERDSERDSESVSGLVAEARALRFESIQADLIYALPQQTPEAFKRTVTQMAALHPTRIALRAHAGLPQGSRPPRGIGDGAPPHSKQAHQAEQAEQRLQMRASAIAGLTRQGYVHIGMDHFALPTDALAIAKRQGRLYRSLQGYTTQPDCDLIALGVSATGCIGATYSQNAKTLPAYQAALAQGRFPVVRGLALSRDDLLRRSVIMAILCQGRVEFESIELAHLVKVSESFAPELQRLQAFEALGLVHVNAQEIQVTDKGCFHIRAIAMVFDRYRPPADAREHFSRVV